MTKFSTLIAAVLMATAGAASTDHMTIGHVQDADTNLELQTITTEADGVVEVYDYHLAQQGELLGSHPLKAGANTDVTVNLSRAPQYNVLVVVKEGDEAVDSTVVRFNEHVAE